MIVIEMGVEKAIDRLLKRFEPWVGRVGEIGYSAEDTERMQREIWKRVEALKL